MLRTYLATQMSWNFPLIIFLSLLILIYIFLCKNNKKLTFSPLQPLLFISGILLLFMMIGSPLLSLSYLSFSLHMVQMSIIYFLVPPLILLGIPSFSKRELQKSKIFLLFSKINIPPIYALIAFATLFLLYHLPIILTFISQHDFWHKVYVTTLFLLAMIMWSPIAAQSSQTTASEQKNYAKLNGILLMPACLFFIVSAFMQEMNNPFMSDIAAHLCLPSENLQILPPPFNTKYDQMLSGVLMMAIHKIGIVVTLNLNVHLHSNKDE